MSGFSDMRWLLANSVNVFASVLYLFIMADVILSWIPTRPDNKIKEFFRVLSDPLLSPIRAMIGKSPLGGGMMIDFSPVIALFIIQILKNVIINVIYMF